MENALARGRFSPGTWHFGGYGEEELIETAGTFLCTLSLYPGTLLLGIQAVGTLFPAGTLLRGAFPCAARRGRGEVVPLSDESRAISDRQDGLVELG